MFYEHPQLDTHLLIQIFLVYSLTFPLAYIGKVFLNNVDSSNCLILDAMKKKYFFLKFHMPLKVYELHNKFFFI